MIDGKLVPFKYDLSKEEREEYKNAENAIKDIIGDATMTVKMV